MKVRLQFGNVAFEADGSPAEIQPYYNEWAKLVTATTDAVKTAIQANATKGMTEQ